MKKRFPDVGMIAGMVIAWTIYYAVSKFMVPGNLTDPV